MECYNTIEKLFIQITDRKNDIINKAKIQSDLFTQHLASKLLIDGITPPPSLLNPNLHHYPFSIHQDFKKDLLSELLPHPQPTVVNRGGFYPPYSQSIVLEGKEELEAREFGEIHGPTFLSDNNGDETWCALNDPEQGVSSASLQGQIAVRTVDNVTEPANGETSKGLSFENLVSDRGCNALDKSSPEFNCTVPFAFQLDQSISSPQVQNETRISGNFASRNQSVYKIQRSRSRQKALELRKTNEKSFTTQRRDRNVSGVCFNEDEIFPNVLNVQQTHQDGELLASAKYSETASHMCEEDQALGECLSKEKDADACSGRIKRSINSHNQSANDSKSKLDITLEVAQVDGEETMRLQNSSVEGTSKNVHLSESSSQRVTRSKSGPSEKFPLNYSNGHGECHSQKDPSSEYTVSHPNNNDIIEQKAKPECPIGTEVILEGSVKIQAVGSESKLDCAGPSGGFVGFDSRPSSNCMIVNPKTLDFDEIERIDSIEVNSPMVEMESLNKSVGKRCESAQSHALPGKVICSSSFAKSVEKQSAEKNIMNQITEPSGDSEMHVIEEDHVMKSAQSHASLGKVTCSSSFAKSVEKQSVEKNIMNQITESLGDSEKHVIEEDHVMESAQSHASLGKTTRSSSFAKSVEKQSAEKNILNQITEPSSDSEKHVLEGEHVMKSAMIRDVEDNSLLDGKIQNSPIHHEEQTSSSNSGEDIDMLNYQKDEDSSIRNQQVQKNELAFKEKIQSERVLLCTLNRECLSFSASSLSTGEGKDPEISPGLNATTANAASSVLDESIQGSKNDCKELVHFEDVLVENMDELSDYKRTLLDARPYIVENSSHHLFPVVSPQDDYLTTSNSDQIMPEFEGFINGEQNSGQSHIVGDSFDSLELPASSVQRASVLEQLCKSAVLYTPLNHFSATHKFHRAPDVNYSVPTLNANAEDERLSASEESQFNTIPFSDTYFSQNLTTPTSPVSKLWTEFHPSLIDRSSSQSLSSGNKLSLNPELVCFPIEEDPSFSEEREDKDDMENSTPEDICSGSIDYGDRRNPLTDITQANGDPLPPLFVAKVSRDRSSLDSVVSEVNFIGTHGGVRRKVDRSQSKRRTATNETKKKLTLSTSTNLMGIGKESLNNGNRKTNLSRKPSLRKDGLSMTGRVSKQNNIISNISSFVPLVQQKQAAAFIIGKRDVKVKALEAAEAVRRLEEKKDNERKLKKEALKLEQARVKQESLRQAELNRKKKEDELKKKEADVAARKRLREEEEKKEKERKRRRFEGKRQQQREQDGKLRAQKLEKELPIGIINAKLNSGTVNADALQKPQKVIRDVDKGDGKGVKKPYAESVLSKSLENDVRQAVVESFEAFGHSRTSIEVTKTSGGKSYEISPYQSSDDEDDEDDEISPKKFVPAWASKKSLALIVSSQQNVDPDFLFAPGTFCSVEEVSGVEAYNKK